MDAEERRLRILQVTRSTGAVAVAELAARFTVAPETVRRDLRALAEEGLISRTHGGARPVESTGSSTPPPSRALRDAPALTRIAAAAVSLLGAAETVFVDEGFTARLIARALPRDRPLTVVTASLTAAHALGDTERITVLLLGGRVRGATLATSGGQAARMLGGFVVDLAYLDADGVSREHGLTVFDPAVAEVRAQAVRGSRRRILAAAATAFGGVGPCRFADVRDVEAIVTGAGVPAAEAQRYSLLGPRVLSV
ncbi:DeoR/GlpR family DNA-binding transcription regulator [Streptomyces yaizuensis]|uniref:Lactose phosphotransferase system repressor n=1 Tax=Streptomyces yaizuensis TaxID=2989713 RepID=A0ABQ5NSZ1_9ACTN|nr:DeoR/GlpR family DNA-binding transcription regulator [Streptomyces sp. YSPA8]GLF93275.1 DeoR/GlpR family DNA-binding transcription regulator [Streptomyces sp. YSPA8]